MLRVYQKKFVHYGFRNGLLDMIIVFKISINILPINPSGLWKLLHMVPAGYSIGCATLISGTSQADRHRAN